MLLTNHKHRLLILVVLLTVLWAGVAQAHRRTGRTNLDNHPNVQQTQDSQGLGTASPLQQPGANSQPGVNDQASAAGSQAFGEQATPGSQAASGFSASFGAQAAPGAQVDPFENVPQRMEGQETANPSPEPVGKMDPSSQVREITEDGLEIKPMEKIALKGEEGQKAAEPKKASLSAIKVIFQLDPRITQGYSGERWVSPSTYTKVQERGNRLTLPAKALGLDAQGGEVEIDPVWKPGNKDIVQVSPTRGEKVEITILKEGKTDLTVTTGSVSKIMTVKAVSQEGVLQVDISQ